MLKPNPVVPFDSTTDRGVLKYNQSLCVKSLRRLNTKGKNDDTESSEDDKPINTEQMRDSIMGSTADGKEEVKDVVAKGSQITIDMAAARTLTSSEGGVDNEQFFSLLQ